MPHINEKLILLAKSASENAYAPYSNFVVGCAIISEKKNLYSACNVENASYGLTICAERAAILKGVSEEGPSFKIEQLVIYTPTNIPVTPCGACRQVMSEFGNNFEVLSVCDGQGQVKLTIDQLLPKPPDFQF